MKIWIGGSSGLAQTYFNTFVMNTTTKSKQNENNTGTRMDLGQDDDSEDDDDESWILLGYERTPPRWIIQLQQKKKNKFHYIFCDLYQIQNNDIHRVMDTIRSVVHITHTNHNTDINNINSILIGIRPPLVTYRTNEAALRYNNAVVDGLYTLLQSIFQQYSTTIRLVVHISSIAAIDHIATQHLRSTAATTTRTATNTTTTTTTTTTDPSYTELQYPYDRFKRQCEMMMEQLVQDINHNKHINNNNNNNNSTRDTGSIVHSNHDHHHNTYHPTTTTLVQYTSLRLGAIFSDSPDCIQCTALFLQFLFRGPYLPTHIDCNSSYNVSQFLHEILQRVSSPLPSSSSTTTITPSVLRPIYYYTRCVSQYPYPIPYGEFLLSYQKAAFRSRRGSSILSRVVGWIPLFIPHVLVEYGVVRLLHGLTTFLQRLHRYSSTSRIGIPFLPPYLESIDYLLQVTLNEHTFDMKETIQDFPNLLHLEETMEECFRRRRQRRP